MKTKQKQQYLLALLLLCLLTIAVLLYNNWRLQQQLNSLAPWGNIEMPMMQNLADPWPKNWDPWAAPWDKDNHFSRLQKHMDEMMSQLIPGQSIFSHRGFGYSPSGPKITMADEAEHYQITITVPKGQQVELNTELSGNVFSLSGKVSNSHSNRDDNTVQQAVSSSQFSQTITLAQAVDESGMRIEEQDQQIVITIPKK
ncbi:Hsp20/alpha crystallin family protein [Dasania sp. GY-MA-18]|uniref:Hsp20/alpha crystallin family protein n=1 Tax=Dasania phycosphaerae TaxID=2950436 RepID=A0A9J6RGY5_9GAMM|nr:MULTISPECIES: Hsp20/alpha crystallin family protein [Dasania]MCR8921279.1 Hsp20/alpha crystallin family protein [Dasania sp. GY-MA-18]MCZ0863707.1 Hsp20/alpha crystallin family protein [Dasania phycosphaerae]MCZ0867435.1 Hsp20/alpha crystallin family protein [Dasania phycosphaerae]